MGSGNRLPYDILEIVFQYLHQEITLVSMMEDITFTMIRPNDVFQCQLVCKGWASLAQKTIYKHITLNSIQHLKSFTNALQNYNKGHLIEYICFRLDVREAEREDVLAYIRYIAQFCTFLKSLVIEPGDIKGIWKLIRDERIKGNFTRLQIIPLVKNQTDENILDYHVAACSLQQTLHELIIHNKNISADESKSWHFPNMNAVCFKFNDFFDTSFINKNMKCFPSATSIEVEIEHRRLSLDRVDTKFPVHISPQVKKLIVTEHYHSTGVSNYLMEAFPNLQEVFMGAESMNIGQLRLSTKEAIQFLEYLLGIEKLTVGYIPIENQYDVMLAFYDKNKHIHSLKIRYIKQPPRFSPPLLSLERYLQVKGQVQIQVIYEYGVPPLLPRIGLIEQSGENLQFLEIDMGLHFCDMDLEVLNSNQGVTASSIFRKCPNLKGISIIHALLRDFGTELELKNRIEIHDSLSFTNSLFHILFLPGLSFWVSRIFQFQMKYCQFLGDRYDNTIREIDMSYTEFHTIAYEDLLQVEGVYLKLIKTLNTTVSWYRIQGRRAFTCTEREFESSLQIYNIFSLTIHCKDIVAVKIDLPGHNSHFKLNAKE